MNCPNCQFENREGAKFCGKCGHKFEITCPECGTQNQAKNNFCDECGSKLSLSLEQVPKQISFDEKLTNYLLPPNIPSQNGIPDWQRSGWFPWTNRSFPQHYNHLYYPPVRLP